MNKSEFDKWLFDNIFEKENSELIIRIGYKYDFESQYYYSNEYYYPDPEFNGLWICENDWYEGQDDIIFVDYIRMEDVFDFDHKTKAYTETDIRGDKR